jgi:hypothetical protein
MWAVYQGGPLKAPALCLADAAVTARATAAGDCAATMVSALNTAQRTQCSALTVSQRSSVSQTMFVCGDDPQRKE